jgi:hypothetical protein
MGVYDNLFNMCLLDYFIIDIQITCYFLLSQTNVLQKKKKKAFLDIYINVRIIFFYCGTLSKNVMKKKILAFHNVLGMLNFLYA